MRRLCEQDDGTIYKKNTTNLYVRDAEISWFNFVLKYIVEPPSRTICMLAKCCTRIPCGPFTIFNLINNFLKNWECRLYSQVPGLQCLLLHVGTLMLLWVDFILLKRQARFKVPFEVAGMNKRLPVLWMKMSLFARQFKVSNVADSKKSNLHSCSLLPLE